MIRPVRFAIVAFLILGVLTTGAFLDLSAPTRTAVPAIELRATPIQGTAAQPADSIAKPKNRAAVRPRNAAGSRVVTRPQTARPATRQSESVTETLAPSEPVASTQPTQPRRETPAGNTPSGGGGGGGGGNGGGNGNGDDGGAQPPPTTNPAPQTPTVGAAAAPAAPPAPAGEDDDDGGGEDDEGGDGDGDDGGDDG
jgi:hypothetical protein